MTDKCWIPLHEASSWMGKYVLVCVPLNMFLYSKQNAINNIGSDA